MRIIDAWWEKRNLGVATQEIVIDKDDTVDEFEKNAHLITANYQVVKVSSENSKVIAYCSKQGFSFFETMFHFFYEIKNPIKQIPQITYRKSTDDDKEIIFSNIESGMYKTDRIYLDPFFLRQQASSRYKNWIKDEMKAGSVFLTLLHENIPIGFCGLSSGGGGIYNQFLTGIFESYQGKGFGISVIDCAVHFIKFNGGTVFKTAVSTNNLMSLRTHIKYGCKIERIEYVFVKHLK